MPKLAPADVSIVRYTLLDQQLWMFGLRRRDKVNGILVYSRDRTALKPETMTWSWGDECIDCVEEITTSEFASVEELASVFLSTPADENGRWMAQALYTLKNIGAITEITWTIWTNIVWPESSEETGPSQSRTSLLDSRLAAIPASGYRRSPVPPSALLPQSKQPAQTPPSSTEPSTARSSREAAPPPTKLPPAIDSEGMQALKARLVLLGLSAAKTQKPAAPSPATTLVAAEALRHMSLLPSRTTNSTTERQSPSSTSTATRAQQQPSNKGGASRQKRRGKKSR